MKLERPNVNMQPLEPRLAALVGGHKERSPDNAIVTSVDGWATGQESMGEGRAAVVCQGA